MKVTSLLCDWAEEINGKLYIQGGGWSRINLAQPATFALALKIYVPWDQANRSHDISASLLDQDGRPVTNAAPDGEQHPIRLTGQFEVGRPPGLRAGTEIDAPLVLRFQGLDLAAGRFYWTIEIDGHEQDRVAFDVVRTDVPGGR